MNAIDRGQFEGSYALGYSKAQTFYKVILPQAAQHFMPLYSGEVVSHIKATAIVGYIAVQDLTKMGDIIRARTYEPFFPLITVAVIYFLFGRLLALIVRAIARRLDPKQRSRERILKGIRTEK